jgi:hypothetical protein
VDATHGELGKLAHQHPRGDEQRHQVEGREEEHRDQNQLGRDGLAGADLEGDPTRDRARRDQAYEDSRVHGLVIRKDRADDGGGAEERDRRRGREGALRRRHRLRPTMPRLADESLQLLH